MTLSTSLVCLSQRHIVCVVKSSLDLPRVKVGVPNIDFKHHINQYILSIWQDDWNGAVANKLHSSSVSTVSVF